MTGCNIAVHDVSCSSLICIIVCFTKSDRTVNVKKADDEAMWETYSNISLVSEHVLLALARGFKYYQD